mmetsp:Transcript_11175/g.25019  ORF Transcript_11175/g.25019 Transcript_11175/m.25019 type:complete len:106 (+) Transcript_11175:202-519(+)
MGISCATFCQTAQTVKRDTPTCLSAHEERASNAAVKIQAAARGMAARKRVRFKRDHEVVQFYADPNLANLEMENLALDSTPNRFVEPAAETAKALKFSDKPGWMR